jgi:hypothetical protein
MSARVSVGAMKISDKNRSSINEEMEKLLITWIKERQMKGDPVTQAMICEKAGLIFEELQKKTPGSTSRNSKQAEDGFIDSKVEQAFIVFSDMGRLLVQIKMLQKSVKKFEDLIRGDEKR